MKGKNLWFRYFGLFLLVIGTSLNIRMFIIEAWPTYLFIIMCIIGVVLMILSWSIKPLKIISQIIWSITLVLLAYLILRNL